MSENIPVTSNINIASLGPLDPPETYLVRQPITIEIANIVAGTREEIKKILHGDDERLLIVVGPCSIHDEKSGLEYALSRSAGIARLIESAISLIAL